MAQWLQCSRPVGKVWGSSPIQGRIFFWSPSCVHRGWKHHGDNGNTPRGAFNILWFTNSSSSFSTHDILVTGTTKEVHLNTLNDVLNHLKKAKLCLKKSKCNFLLPSVVFLGHKIDAQGLYPLLEKVKAIKDGPKPRNVSELKSYLGAYCVITQSFCQTCLQF